MTVVTEEEAEKKTCIHRMAANWGGTVCMGSRCMAWRWVKGNPVAGTGRGYCGLAGRP